MAAIIRIILICGTAIALAFLGLVPPWIAGCVVIVMAVLEATVLARVPLRVMFDRDRCWKCHHKLLVGQHRCPECGTEQAGTPGDAL